MLAADLHTDTTRCDTTDLLAMLTVRSEMRTIAGNIRNGVELRPHATEDVVTLVLGHAPYGLAGHRTSTHNSCCSDHFGARHGGDTLVGRAGIIITACDPGVWSMASVKVLPARLSGLDTEVVLGQSIDELKHRQEMEMQS